MQCVLKKVVLPNQWRTKEEAAGLIIYLQQVDSMRKSHLKKQTHHALPHGKHLTVKIGTVVQTHCQWCIRFWFKDWGLSTLKTPNQRENQLPHGGTSAFMFCFCQPVLTLCSLCLQSSMPTSCLYWVHPLMTRCGHLYAIQPLPNLDANMTFNTWNSNWVIFWTLIGRLWNVQEI